MKLIQKATTRCKGMGPLAGIMMAVLCLILMISSPAVAANSFDPYPMGWYDSQAGTSNPPLMAADTHVMGGQGSNITIAYYSGTDENRTTYLNAAFKAGVDVMMGIDMPLVDNTDTAAISAFVAQWDHCPAIVGWYLYDEPGVWGVTITRLQPAYNAIKAESSKPVLIVFSPPYGIRNGNAVSWSGAYDILGVDAYSARVGEIEFSGLGVDASFPYTDDWKGTIDLAQAASVTVGKPLWSVAAGWGDLEGETGMYRFPTNAEDKFATFYSILRDASAIIHFSYYRAKQVPAKPAEAYPYDGPTWLETVASLRNDEVNLLGPALREGSIGSNAVSSSDPNILGDVYQDPDTDILYVVALSDTTGDKTPPITLNLQGLPPVTPVAVRPLFEGDIPPIPLTAGGTQFSDDFSSYEVHLYQVMYEPDDCLDALADGYDFVGDIDGDCDVDIDDLESFVNAWLNCVEPGGSGCQTPWVP